MKIKAFLDKNASLKYLTLSAVGYFDIECQLSMVDLLIVLKISDIDSFTKFLGPESDTFVSFLDQIVSDFNCFK